jgi:hypothetical protein
MDALHQSFLDYQVKANQLYRLEFELDLQIVASAKTMDLDLLDEWDPYGDKKVLRAIRESRFLESSVILFDLDGFAEAPNSMHRTLGILSLIEETRSNFADIIIGMPQYFIRPADTEAPHVFMWDVEPRLEIPVPNSIVESVFHARAQSLENAEDSRYDSLNFKLWLMRRKEEIAMRFLEYANGNGLSHLERGSSWIADRIVDGLKDADRSNYEQI